MESPHSPIPIPESSIEDKKIFLQGNIVNFVRQYQLPIIEVSLVISKYLRILTESLVEQATVHGEVLPDSLLMQRPFDPPDIEPVISEFPLDSLIGNVDQDRMDILDTIIRTSITNTELPFSQAIPILRDWEELTRKQLSEATSPGHLFTPLGIPDGF
tara:strand:+ start:1072 stop:1545 length:474 start_codon:yes stop_codon:yes gene_type:complete